PPRRAHGAGTRHAPRPPRGALAQGTRTGRRTGPADGAAFYRRRRGLPGELRGRPHARSERAAGRRQAGRRGRRGAQPARGWRAAPLSARRAMRPRTAGAAALIGLLLWLVAYPLVLTLIEGLRANGTWTLEHVRAFLARPTALRARWVCLWISVASVVLAAAIGVPLALLFARYDFPGRRLFGPVVALPAVLPPLVGVIAFLFLYGESGFLAHLVRHIFALEEAPWRFQGAGAILLVHAY